jgi:hypothetical protein
MQTQDPDRAQQLWMAYQQLKLKRDGAAKELEGKKTEHLNRVRDAETQRLQKVDAALSDPLTGIKGWGPDLLRNLVQFAGANGISPAELRNGTPATWKVLHDAHQWRQHQAKQAAVTRQKQSQTTTPARTVTTRAAAVSPLSDRAGTDDWIKARNAQVLKRA